MLTLDDKYGSARKQKLFLLGSINLKWMVSGFPVSNATIDESPMAYKNSNEIIQAIEPTAEIIDHLKPLYNFKAEE